MLREALVAFHRRRDIPKGHAEVLLKGFGQLLVHLVERVNVIAGEDEAAFQVEITQRLCNGVVDDPAASGAAVDLAGRGLLIVHDVAVLLHYVLENRVFFSPFVFFPGHLVCPMKAFFFHRRSEKKWLYKHFYNPAYLFLCTAKYLLKK